MGKIKLTERQILMLQKLEVKTSNESKVLRITESQYNRLFKKGKATKKLDKSIKKSGMLGEETKKLDLVEFAEEMVVFIKDVLSKTDYRTMPLSPYWAELGISKGQLFKLVKKHGLLSLADEESEIREYAAPKHGFRKKIKELYNIISEMGDSGYPAGAGQDSNAPWNQPDGEEPQEEIISIPKEKRKFKVIHFGDEGMTVFKAANELFVASLSDIGDINNDPVEWDGKVYMYDYNPPYTDDITAQGFEDYINDMYSQGEIKPVRNDNADKFPVPTLLTPKIKEKILGWYGKKDPRMVQALSHLPETTTAASSGAYVGGASFDGPIKKDMSNSPADEMGSLINDNRFGQEAVVAYAGELSGENKFEVNGEEWIYCWGDYNGKKDIAVYRPKTDMAYDYSWFRKTVLGIDEEIAETTSTATVGAGVGANGQGTQTDPQYAYDAPAGDGKDFWTAGNKLNKKMGTKGTPIVRGGVNERRKLFTESEEQFLNNPEDKFRSGFELDELQQLYFEYTQIHNGAPARSIEEYETYYKQRLESKVLEAKAIKAEQAGEDASLFKEEMNKRQEYLSALDQWKIKQFLSKHDPKRQKAKNNLLMKAKALGIDLQLKESKVIRVTQEQFEKIVESENMSKTAYPNGEMISFDDCTKFNNNTKAQDGGCSTGAVDGVVKTKKTKGSVVAENFNPQVGAGSVYAIEVAVKGAKIILKQDNGQHVVVHYDDIPQLINILNGIQ